MLFLTFLEARPLTTDINTRRMIVTAQIAMPLSGLDFTLMLLNDAKAKTALANTPMSSTVVN